MKITLLKMLLTLLEIIDSNFITAWLIFVVFSWLTPFSWSVILLIDITGFFVILGSTRLLQKISDNIEIIKEANKRK
ncbi:MAG: hypothetical protein RR575_13135 [Acinetobacter sp.]